MRQVRRQRSTGKLKVVADMWVESHIWDMLQTKFHNAVMILCYILAWCILPLHEF